MPKLISIIIPCYNVEKYIDNCINSLINQTIGIENLELILVDDASTDGTWDKIIRYEELYSDSIIAVHLDENGRQGRARNIGISYASAPYVGYMDSDDWAEYDMYEKLYARITEGAYDIVMCRNWRDPRKKDGQLSPKKNPIDDQELIIDTVDKRREFIAGGSLGYNVWDKLYKKDFLIDNGIFFPEGLAYEDHYFSTLIYFYAVKVYIMEERLYHYYVNTESTVLQTNVAHHFDILTVNKLVWDECVERKLNIDYLEEMQFNFLVLCYLVSMKMICLRMEHVPADYFFELKRETLARINDYQSNRYVTKYLKEREQLLLQLLSMTVNEELLERICNHIRVLYRDNTLPIALIEGDNSCYGVPKGFICSLKEAFIEIGQPVVVLGKDSAVCRDNYKAILGVQSGVLHSAWLNNVKGVRVQMFLDNPLFHHEYFANSPDDDLILCQDANHVKLLQQYYNKVNAVQLPPGGMIYPYNIEEKPIYDMVFIGSFYPEQNFEMDEKQKLFYEYMLEHPRLSFEQGLTDVLKLMDINLSRDDFATELYRLRRVCQRIIDNYRKKVIDAILDVGISIQVYGDSWKQYSGPRANQLIIHRQVQGNEALREWHRARIGLNIMSWHKGGMTERIANIMMAGSVCLSDETDYLKQNFINDKEIVLYSLDDLEALKHKVVELLKNDKMRRSVACAGYKKAMDKHTWRERAREILKEIEKINK